MSLPVVSANQILTRSLVINLSKLNVQLSFKLLTGCYEVRLSSIYLGAGESPALRDYNGIKV